MARFSVRLPFLRRLDCNFIILVGVVKSRIIMLGIAEVTCGSSFEPSDTREQKLGYVKVPGTENNLEKTWTLKSLNS